MYDVNIYPFPLKAQKFISIIFYECNNLIQFSHIFVLSLNLIFFNTFSNEHIHEDYNWWRGPYRLFKIAGVLVVIFTHSTIFQVLIG